MENTFILLNYNQENELIEKIQESPLNHLSSLLFDYGGHILPKFLYEDEIKIIKPIHFNEVERQRTEENNESKFKGWDLAYYRERQKDSEQLLDAFEILYDNMGEYLGYDSYCIPIFDKLLMKFEESIENGIAIKTTFIDMYC